MQGQNEKTGGSSSESGSRETIKYNQAVKVRVTDSSLSIAAHTCWENGERINQWNAKRRRQDERTIKQTTKLAKLLSHHVAQSLLTCSYNHWHLNFF